MILYVSLGAALLWFAFVAVLLYAKSSPEAQVRRRIMEMIESAESLRLQNQQNSQKNLIPTSVSESRFLSQKNFFERRIKFQIKFKSSRRFRLSRFLKSLFSLPVNKVSGVLNVLS